MQFKATLLALGAFAATVIAQSASLQFTTFPPSTAQAGSSYTVTYMTAQGQINEPVTILLRRGTSNNLQTVSTLTTSVTGGSYQFKPSSSLASGTDYALEIQQGSSTNYSPQFAITGGSGSSSSSSASSASSSASSSAASSYGSSSSTIATYSVSSSASSTATYYPVNNATSYAPVGPTGTVIVGTTVPAASGSLIPTPARNTTFVSATLSPSATLAGTTIVSSTPAASSTSSSSGAGSIKVGSPLALIAGIVAGIVYLN